MALLVTGATGFLGARICALARAEGEPVIALGRNREAGARLEALGCEFRAVDLEEAAPTREAFAGATAVVHAAALSSPWGEPRAFERANVEATEHVLAAMRAHGVRRLAHVSTPSVYFAFRDRHGIAESEPLPARFANEYARTKAEAEARVRAAVEAGTHDAVILRPRGIFGPGDTALMPRLLRVAERLPRFPLFGGGEQLVDLTYVDNVADACRLALAHAEARRGGVYNVTNGEPVALGPTVGAVFARLGVPFRPLPLPRGLGLWAAGRLEARAERAPGRPEPPLTRYTVGVLSHAQTLDISAARRDLGYRPAVSMAEGIERFARWWEEQPHGGS